MATLAHELRNPLAPISNAVHYLGMDGLTITDVKTARDVIARQVITMVRLIDDLLDVSRISRNTLGIRNERVDLAAVLESALESSRPLIEKSGHELTVSLPTESARSGLLKSAEQLCQVHECRRAYLAHRRTTRG
jgi:signal transduction histidine kinase